MENSQTYSIDVIKQKAGLNNDAVLICEHKGKQINFVDYSNIHDINKFVEKVKAVDEYNKRLIAAGVKDLLILSDFSNSFVLDKAYTALKESGYIIKPYVKKTALIGISKTKKLLVNTANFFLQINIRSFEDLESACDWLLK